jgi:hypothetical protein
MNGSDAGHNEKNMLLADLYKFDKFRKNSSRNVLLAIDYLPFYLAPISLFFHEFQQNSQVFTDNIKRSRSRSGRLH